METKRSSNGFSIIYKDSQACVGGEWMPVGEISCRALNISKETVARMEEQALGSSSELYGSLMKLDCVAMTTRGFSEQQSSGVLDDIICFRIYVRHFINKYLMEDGETMADPIEAYSRYAAKIDSIVRQVRREDALRRTVLPREFTPRINFICRDGGICEQYVFPTLCQLLLFDQLRALQYDKAARKCRNCDNYFTPDRRNAGYCERPAPGDPMHTCREVGARRVFVKRHEGSQAYKLCAAACGRIYTRKSRGSLSAEEAAELLTKCMALRAKAVSGEITIEQLGTQLAELTMSKKK